MVQIQKRKENMPKIKGGIPDLPNVHASGQKVIPSNAAEKPRQ